MVINRVIPVREIPKTTSGKLQRFKLLEQYQSGKFDKAEMELNRLMKNLSESQEEEMGSFDPIENLLYQIWGKALGIHKIGLSDKFFEIGGDSLKAAEMGRLIRREFEVEIPPTTLYDKPTIKQLAGEIRLLERKEFLPISKAPDRRFYNLSSTQRKIYYLWELDKSSIAYNIPVALKLSGKIDRTRLENCIYQLIHRHDSLKMSFRREVEPEFEIHPDIDFSLESIECNSEELDEKLKSLVVPFDLNRAPLFRARYLNTEGVEDLLFLDFHHIIADGISISIFIEELQYLYDGEELAPLPKQYKDFVQWEAKRLASYDVSVRQKEYWANKLSEPLPILEMPLDFPREVIFEAKGSKLRFDLGKELSKQVKTFAKANNCTANIVLFSLYNLALAKYSGQEEIIIGLAVAGRNHPDLQNMFGMFVNSLAIRSRVENEKSFLDLLEFEKANLAEAYSNWDYPFEKVREEGGESRNVSRNSVFDSMFMYHAFGAIKPGNLGISFSRYFFDPGYSKFDISMEVFDEDESLKYYIEYSTKLFETETAENFGIHFKTLVEKALKYPERRLSELSLISKSELAEHLYSFNATDSPYPNNILIHNLFEKQVLKTPQNIAIEFGNQHLTYKELDEKANHVASLLRKKNLKPNQFIGIKLSPSPELVISILGVLKAGCAYLPIDTDLPQERVQFMVKNAQCTTLITKIGRGISPAYSDWGIDVIDMDRLISSNGVQDKVVAINRSDDLAYLIYTSGTTGKPKGVMVEHKSLVNYIYWASKTYLIEGEGDFPLFTSISFDLTISSIFIPLVSGRKIVIYEKEENEIIIEKIIADNKVNAIKLTPSHLKILKESLILKGKAQSKIRKIIVGGEQLDSELARTIHKKFNGKVEIFNEYGPTEATVGCMVHKFDPNWEKAIVPIGVPIDNTQIYVLDKYLKPIPTGILGEIYIAGEGLAQGYLGDGQLTRKRFISNPFANGTRMYKTGDLARRLPEGILEFKGRSDRQIKINGYRIELAEIESQLLSNKHISEAIVISRKKNNGHLYLCAYYMSKEKMKVVELKNYLSERLPRYMIPNRLIRLDSIPLTTNGKVDYRKLPLPNFEKPISSYSLPQNEAEKVSLQIWEQVLGETSLTIQDNFFELGGDSIKAVQISSRLVDMGISLNAKDLLTYQTIEQISLNGSLIEIGQKYSQESMVGMKNFSPIESWFFSQKFENPNFYTQSVCLRFLERINIDFLTKAFEKLIQYHDALRLNWSTEKDKLFFNEAHLKGGFSIGIHDVTQDLSLSNICENLRASIDLNEGLLLKAAIIRELNGSELVFITIHHIGVDAVSWRIFLKDLYTIYHQLQMEKEMSLPQKTASLFDWGDKLGAYTSSKQMEEESSYWSEIDHAEFTIPQDFDTQNWQSVHTHVISKKLSKEETNFLIKEAHKVYQTDVFILLNAALTLVLNKWMGENQFVIEQEHHGRSLERLNTSRTMGWFTSMYPILLRLKEGEIGDHIKSIKEQIRKVPNYGMGYGVKKILEREGNQSAKRSEIRFNYLGELGHEFRNALFEYVHLNSGRETAPTNHMTAKLEMNAMVLKGELNLEIAYNTLAHKGTTIEWLIEGILKEISQILLHIQNQVDIYFTPSDFELVTIDQEELDALFS